MNVRASVIALGAGLLFGFGLVLSGMSDPANVLAFLTLDANWNPSLALVMGGALAVAVPGFAWLRRRASGSSAVEQATLKVDARLVFGAAAFGLGWGLAGFCPGPAVVTAGLLQESAWLFLPAMFAGAWLAELVS